MKIFISCGHNNAFNFINDHGKVRLSAYKDQGATVTIDQSVQTEYQYSRKIANELIKKFPTEPGTTLVLLPEGLNLDHRIAYINKNAVDGDMCIELHLDSATPQAEGCTTYFMTGSKYAEDKARIFQQEYTRVTGIKGRGVKGDTTNRWGRLGFVRDTKCLSFLLEMGFLSNEGDRNKTWTKAAEGISLGLALITPL